MLPFTIQQPHEIREFKIYCLRHRDSGRMYFGMTRGAMSARIAKHVHESVAEDRQYAPKISLAIREFGRTSFDAYVLESGLTRTEASNRERHYISLFCTTDESKGFNTTRGGPGNPADRRTESRKKLSESHKRRHAKNRANGIPTVGSRAVIQLSPDGTPLATYASIAEASVRTGAIRSNISLACGGRLKQAGGFLWKYADGRPRIPNGGNSRIGVECVSMDGELISVYPSIHSAAASTNTPTDALVSALRGGRPSAGGFIWRVAV